MEDISLFVLDLAQNSISAKAKLVIIEVTENSQLNLLKVELIDDGKGMSEEMVQKVTDPFFTTRTTRRVGLGLPMAKAASTSCGGNFSISSQIGKGTKITLEYLTDNIDCPPFGKMEQTIFALIATNSEIDFVYKHSTLEGTFVLDTRLIKKELNEVPINSGPVLQWISEYIIEGINEVNGGMKG